MGTTAKCSWDDEKEASNIERHGYAFDSLDEVFDGRFVFTVQDKRKQYGEDRYNSLVEFKGHVINIAFTPRAGRVRLISVRRASRDERTVYYARKPTA